MGNAAEGQNFLTEDEVLKEYQLIASGPDNRFGEIKIYKHIISGMLYWIKHTWIEDEKAYQEKRAINDASGQYTGDFINSTIIFVEAERSGCGHCGPQKKMITIMDYIERTLESEIESRCETKVIT